MKYNNKKIKEFQQIVKRDVRKIAKFIEEIEVPEVRGAVVSSTIHTLLINSNLTFVQALGLLEFAKQALSKSEDGELIDD